MDFVYNYNHEALMNNTQIVNYYRLFQMNDKSCDRTSHSGMFKRMFEKF
ncbi:hypothetical protein COO91_04325 [Nostoc flagelliforme CCNUN1]|uniref:Uncharacterized protein n=1 Tax=Nostoc flagelliforme CCNUN1 TaxID=2038116 RepID=A0A2K8SU86_9NOSO|nr:hypothetical protein COO91_04325 [Nostoc flagelliforme CCNUN1]